MCVTFKEVWLPNNPHFLGAERDSRPLYFRSKNALRIGGEYLRISRRKAWNIILRCDSKIKAILPDYTIYRVKPKEEVVELNKGRKDDIGKQRWVLLPQEVEEIVEVLTFGADKYEDNSWQKVENGVDRYYSAALRHIMAWKKGERDDKESGIRHLAHAATNLLFLLHLTKEK